MPHTITTGQPTNPPTDQPANQPARSLQNSPGNSASSTHVKSTGLEVAVAVPTSWH